MYAGFVVCGNKGWKQFGSKKLEKRRPQLLPTNQIEQFYYQRLGQDMGILLQSHLPQNLNPISTATFCF